MIREHIGATLAGIALLLSLGSIAAPAEAASLTSAQVQAILSLLSSFGADQSTINNVSVALGGTSNSTGLSCSSFTNLHYGDFDETPGGKVSQLQTWLGIPSSTFGFGTYGRKTLAAWNAQCGGVQTTTQTNTQTTPSNSTANTTTQNTNTTSGTTAGATTISLTYPQAGNVLANNSAKSNNQIATIQWNEQNGNYPISLWLQNSNGQIVKAIATNIADTGSYVWASDPSLPTGTYQIRIDVLYPSGAGGQDSAYSGYFTLQNQSSSITVTYPAGGEQLQYNTGKDVDFRVNWTTSNYSNTVNVYLVSSSGSLCRIGSTSSSNGTFPITIGANFQCANGQPVPTSGQYRVEVSGDDGLGDGKQVGGWSGYFTFSPAQSTQPSATITSSLQASANGKSAALVTVSGTATNVNQVIVSIKGQTPAYATVTYGAWSGTITSVYPNTYTVQIIDNDAGANNGTVLASGTLTVTP